MFNKASLVRFFAVVIVVLCIGARVSADVQLKGRGTKRIVFDKDTFDYQIDYRPTYAFYNTTNRNQVQYYTLHVGGCNVEFKAVICPQDRFNRHHEIKLADHWEFFHDDFPPGTFNSSINNFRGHGNFNISCNVQFDNSLVPGKYVINVSFTGEVAPNLIVNFVGAELFTESMIPTNAPEKPMLEVWQIALIVGIVVLAAIILCIVIFCCCCRKKKTKAQKVAESEHSTAASTMSTVQEPLVKETNLYGPDLMHFGKNITEGAPNAANSQAISPAPQATSPAPQAVSPAPVTSPMPTPQ